jgi:predicted nuclease with RNAse H fold
VNIGFGLDLAGLSNHRGTVLASIRAEGELADVNILQSSPFGTKMSGSFEDRLKRESLALSDLLRIGKVSVDVPIALQGLPDVEAKEAWQLTLRPVDKKLKALPPLASLLGACVARFKAILTKEHLGQLGKRLFETYPKASFVEIFGKNSEAVKFYKLASAKKRVIAENARLALTRDLKIIGGETLSHNELDAVICAMASIATDDEIVSEGGYDLPIGFEVPTGYRILRSNPFKEIKVSRVLYDVGLKEFDGHSL